MQKHRISLRSVLSILSLAITVLALVSLGLLLFITHYSNGVSAALAVAVENVRAAEETQIALLVHERVREKGARRIVESEMLRNLAAIRPGARGEASVALQRAESLVHAYLEGTRRAEPPSELPDQFAAAFTLLEEVSELNIARARAAREAAARWDRRSNVLGGLATVGLISLTAWLLWWTRAQVFKPVFELAAALERFGRGELDVRAEVRGPSEVRDMVERFNQMAVALSARRQAQLAFLAGVAHDLRNPISALSLSVSMIDPAQPLPPEPRIRRTIELVRRQLDRLERMVSDLMDVTKVQAGQLELQLERHDLRELVRDVAQLFEATQPEQRIQLALPDEPVWVECDEVRIEQVVSNLISNAIKYSPNGRDIDVSLAQRGAAAVLSVRDHGIGISEADQRRLFEPFRRAALSKDTVPGAGLGLYVVQRLVAAHGGSIEVTSTPGEGSVFTVQLPFGGEASERRPRQPEPAEPAEPDRQRELAEQSELEPSEPDQQRVSSAQRASRA